MMGPTPSVADAPAARVTTQYVQFQDGTSFGKDSYARLILEIPHNSNWLDRASRQTAGWITGSFLAEPAKETGWRHITERPLRR
jgi:hypothetical protein